MTTARRHVLGIICVMVLGMAGFAVVAPTLTASLSDYDDPRSDFTAALSSYRDATGVDLEQGLQIVVDCDRAAHRSARDDGCPAIDSVRTAVSAVPGVVTVADAHTTGRADFLSADGRYAYTAVGVDVSGKDAEFVDRMRSAIDEQADVGDAVIVGGPTVANAETAAISTDDLVRAELLAFPVLVVALLWVLRNVAAAIVPLVGAGFAIVAAFIPLALVSVFTDLSTFALNLVTALGTGLSIDFSLLMIARFRELVDAGSDVDDAVRITTATAGRTVLFSGVTIAAAVATLCVFPQRFLYSMGVAGASVAVAATLFARWVLPLILRTFGARMARTPGPSVERSRRRWERWTRVVARRPGAVALAGVLVIAALTYPVTSTHLRGYDIGILPDDADAAQVGAAMAEHFPQATDDVVVLLPTAVDASASAARIGAVTGVSGATRTTPVTPELTMVAATLADDPTTPAAQHTLDSIRATLPPGTPILGEAARFESMVGSIADRVPWLLLLLVVISCGFLYRLTGSVVIPIKNVIMCSLTVCATLGILVVAFQWGPLGGPGIDSIEVSSLIIVAVLSFGLSTDYASFLFHRMTEEWRDGASPEDAVRIGVSRTGPVVTAAAALLFVPLFALTASQLSPVQQLGFGAAIAVVLDATVMRTLLAPSLMTMLGRWNWWPHLRRPGREEVAGERSSVSV